MRIVKEILHKWLFAHPESVGETYCEHGRVALGFSMQLFRAAGACLVHAMLPACFVTSASQTVDRLYGRMFTGRRGELASGPAGAADPTGPSRAAEPPGTERIEGRRV